MAGSGVGVCRYRIGFWNVQGLTIAKAVVLRSIIQGGLVGYDVDGSTKLILGSVETHEKFNRLDWGDDIEHIEQMREQTDKKGGGLTMLKDRDDYNYDKLDNTFRDILNVKLDLGRLNIYVLMVYLDVKDKERNKYIYENLDLMMREMDNQMPVIVMGNFNGHVGFLGNRDKNYIKVKGKVFYGQEPPSGESTTTECGVNCQLLTLMLLK